MSKRAPPLVETYLGMLACWQATSLEEATFVCSMVLSKFCADILVLVHSASTSRMVYKLSLSALSASPQGMDASNVEAASCNDWAAVKNMALGHPLLKDEATLDKVAMHLTTWQAMKCVQGFASCLDTCLTNFQARKPGAKPKKQVKLMTDLARQLSAKWLRPNNPKNRRAAPAGQGLFVHSLVCFEQTSKFFFELHKPGKSATKRPRPSENEESKPSLPFWLACNTIALYQKSASELYVSFPGINLRVPLVMYPEKTKDEQQPWSKNMWWQ